MNDIMNVRQFTGGLQEKQDAFAQSHKPAQPAQQTATGTPSLSSGIAHTEIAAHGNVPRLPGATSGFNLNQAPKATVLGQGARAI